MKKSFRRLLHIILACSLLFFVSVRGGVFLRAERSSTAPVVAMAETATPENTNDAEAAERLKWGLVGSGSTLIVIGCIGVIVVLNYRKKDKNSAQKQEISDTFVIQATPLYAEQREDLIVHCLKCNSALRVKSEKTAYICPVCGTTLRVRIVKGKEEK